ncbi:MAG TPA: hypothetical protein ENI82_06500 [Bacteroidetes bacterium]|nr:hypothetical protein [Bacteroidota bacterium]
MKQTFYLFIVISIFTSCNVTKRAVEKIDFTTKYKFSSEIEDKVARDTVPWKYQISASDYATKGDYKNALKHWDLAMGVVDENLTKEQIDSINGKYKKLSAIDFIIKEAEKVQVVMINEAHHNASHRMFTKSLLQKLFDVGYTNLGLETLSDDDPMLHERKYPIQESGTYSNEPQFGNLIRTALEIGYHLFPYESKGHGGDTESREIDQAKNIQEVLATKPNEKFLIHCGFDHNLEGVHPYWGNTMASRFTEYTGINPLTINQVKYSEKSNSKFNNPFLKALTINQPTILIDSDEQVYKYQIEKAWNDIAVLHPNTKYINDRADWLFKNGNQNVEIKLKDIELEFPVLVFAFKKGEPINEAVPVDIYEVKQQSDTCHLGLKKGNYEIVITNGKGAYKFEKQVN